MNDKVKPQHNAKTYERAPSLGIIEKFFIKYGSPTSLVSLKSVAGASGGPTVPASEEAIPTGEGLFTLLPVISREGVAHRLHNTKEPNIIYKNTITVKDKNLPKYVYQPVKSDYESRSMYGVSAEKLNEKAKFLSEEKQKGEKSDYIKQLLEKVKEAVTDYVSKQSAASEIEVDLNDFFLETEGVSFVLDVAKEYASGKTQSHTVRYLRKIFDSQSSDKKFREALGKLDSSLIGIAAATTRTETLLYMKSAYEAVRALTGDELRAILYNKVSVPLELLNLRQNLLYIISELYSNRKPSGGKVALLTPRERDLQSQLLEVSNTILRNNMFLVNQGGEEFNQEQFSQKLIGSAVVQRAVAAIRAQGGGLNKDKKLGCYDDKKGLDFSGLPGFSEKSGATINNFFDACTGMSVEFYESPAAKAKVLNQSTDNAEKAGLKFLNCSNSTEVPLSHIKIKCASGASLTLDFNAGGKFSTLGLQKARSSTLHNHTYMRNLFGSGNFLTPTLVYPLLSAMAEDRDFLLVEDGQGGRETFSLVYNTTNINNHRGELGVVMAGMLVEPERASEFINPEPVPMFRKQLEYIREHFDQFKEDLIKYAFDADEESGTFFYKNIASFIPLVLGVEAVKDLDWSTMTDQELISSVFKGFMQNFVVGREFMSPEQIKKVLDSHGFLVEGYERYALNLQWFLAKLNPRIRLEFSDDPEALPQTKNQKLIENVGSFLLRFLDPPKEVVEDGDGSEEEDSGTTKKNSLKRDPNRPPPDLKLFSRLHYYLLENKTKFTESDVDVALRHLKKGITPPSKRIEALSNFMRETVDLIKESEVMSGLAKELEVGDEFFYEFIRPMFEGLGPSTIPTKIFENLGAIGVLSNYGIKPSEFKVVVKDDSSKYRLVALKELTKGASPAQKAELLHQALLGTSVKFDSKRKVIYEPTKQVRQFVIEDQSGDTHMVNFKLGMGGSSGCVDFAIVTARKNKEGTYSLIPGLFEFKCSVSETGVRHPHFNDALTFAEQSLNKYIKYADLLFDGSKELKLERGHYLTLGTRKTYKISDKTSPEDLKYVESVPYVIVDKPNPLLLQEMGIVHPRRFSAERTGSLTSHGIPIMQGAVMFTSTAYSGGLPVSVSPEGLSEKQLTIDTAVGAYVRAVHSGSATPKQIEKLFKDAEKYAKESKNPELINYLMKLRDSYAKV